MDKNKKIWGLVILALIGLGLSVKLAMIYYSVNFLNSLVPSFCVLNEVVDCDAVARTPFAEFMGIPLALWGVLLYSFIIFLCFAQKLAKIKFLSILNVFKNPVDYIFSLYFVSFLISIILVFVQFFAIQKFCLLCFITYLVDLVSLFIAKDYTKPFGYEFKVSVMDFIDAVKVKTNLIALIIVAMLGLSGIAYAKTTYLFTPHLKRYYSITRFEKLKGNPFNVTGNTLGNPDGNVIVYEYSDFECPMCRIMNKMLQKAGTEYENVFIVHYNYPLDMACNPLVTRPFHQKSCKYAKYAIAAKEQNKYWEMINILFDKQPKSNEEVFKLAEKNGIDANQLANDYISNQNNSELAKEIFSGLSKKIDGTPTIYVNTEKHTGVMSYEELQEVLEKNGAILKKK